LIACFAACSANKDLSTANGQQAIIDQANDYLTAGDCDQAISVLSPLINSQYSSYAALMVYASAYACKGGIAFTSLIGTLTNLGGQDIWGALIKTNYSNGSDGKEAALDQAAQILYNTASTPGVFQASLRTCDANLYMILVQMNIIATVISPPAMGNANPTTGKKGQPLTNGLGPGPGPGPSATGVNGTANDWCHVEVAFAEISDSANYASSSTVINNITSKINSICSKIPGGLCPTNEDLNACLSNTGYQWQGQLVIAQIDSMWN
jgi:hypothetical protein